MVTRELAREFSVLARARALDAAGWHADSVDWPIRVHDDARAGTRIMCFGSRACPGCREAARGFWVLACARALDAAGLHADSVFWLARVLWMTQVGTRILCFGSRACPGCRRAARGFCVLARARALDAARRHADSIDWPISVHGDARAGTRIQCFGSRACSGCRRSAREFSVLARVRALDDARRHANSVFWLVRVPWMPRGGTRIQ